MSRSDEPSGERKSTFGDARDDVVTRAQSHGLEFDVYSVTTWSEDGDVQMEVLDLHLPNGRDRRSVRVGPRLAPEILATNFTQLSILGEYVAVLDRSTGVIEAALSSAGGPLLGRLISLPGVVAGRQAKMSDEEPDSDVSDESVDAIDQIRAGEFVSWYLPISMANADFDVEIRADSRNVILAHPYSHRYSSTDRRIGPCIRISRAQPVLHHDEAVEILETIAASVTFEIDVKFGIPATLMRHRPLARPGGRRGQPQPSTVGVVENLYAKEAVSMYFYGRSARGMPLLQYLAYYQSIEFFFPSFSNADVLRRLRLCLRDPRFDKDDDAKLQRLVAIARGSLRGGMSERDQLKATLEGSVEEADLRSFIESARLKFTTQKDGPIKFVKWLNPKSTERLVDQVAERIYRIRCRIVHTKESGGDTDVEVLLPFGVEAESLTQDIELVRFVAQKVIIAGSRGSL